MTQLLVMLSAVIDGSAPPLGIGSGGGAGLEMFVEGAVEILSIFLALGYLFCTVVGAVAWHRRGVKHVEERLPGRQRALPPAPRSWDA